MNKIRNGIVLMLVMTMCSGCVLLVGAAVFIPVYNYIKGEIEVSYNATLDSTWVACQDALKEVGIEITDSIREKSTHWMLKGRAKDGEEIEVTLDVISDQVTKVSIDGKEELCRKIHDAIATAIARN